MKISNAFPSKFIKAADLQDRQHELTIQRVEMEVVGNDDEKKPTIYFTGRERGLALNKTNAKTIAAAYGDDTDAWSGKKVILFPTLVDFRGDQVEAIRVKIPKAPAKQAAAESENPGVEIDDTF